MTLDDIYTQLAYGELRQLFLGGDLNGEDSGIDPENYPKLLPSIQLGLTELHKKFLLREGRFKVVLQPSKAVYLLTKKFATSNNRSKEPVKYIDDSQDAFTNNLFKVERVYGVCDGERYEIPMNELNNMEALRTTSYNTLLVPTSEAEAPWLKETKELEVVYRADHPEISTHLANASPQTTEIFLPATHLEALLFYVASRLHNPIGMTPGAMHEGNNYFQRYLASVQELENLNYQIDDDAQMSKLHDRGFC